MSPILWVGVLATIGVVLVLAASRATGTVTQGKTFVRWMLLVFAAFLALASIPIFAA